MSRRPSENYDRPPLPPQKPSTMEKNCAQIFTKGPALTRDILEKMQNDKRQIMGYEINTKQLWVLSGLLLLFLLSLSGMIAMWFTDTFDNVVFSNLAIVPTTKSYEMWLKPTPKPYIKMYIFNYTNVDRYKNKEDEKLNVKEVGPYVYEMTLERIYPIFNGSKVTYKEKRSFKFLPELSKGRQNDQVTIPNIPLLAAAAVNKQATFLTRVGLSGLLNSLNAQPFITLAAHRAIVGYNDNLYTLSKSYMKLQNKKVRDSIGLFANSIGERDEWITVNTGVNDINKVGLYDNFDGQKSMQQWSTEECDDFSDATDGYLFPPKLVRNKRPLKYFTKDICRAFPFYFEKEVRILNGKIPAYRYALAEDVFDHPDKTPSNQCYCDLDLGECPLQGLFNATPCANGAPIFMSFPHFYKADPVLKNGVTGLKPNPEYRTYIDLHPTLGYTMGCKNRFQVNIQVNKAFGISQVNMFEDNMMLPFAWFEYSVEDKTLPEDMVGIIFQTTFTLRSVELGLKYGCLLTMGVTLFGIFMVLRNRWTSRVRTSSVRPLHNDP